MHLIPLALVAATAVSQAAILVNESFSGYNVGAINGQAVSGLGLSGSWTGGSAHHNYQSPGLSLAGVYSAGGSLRLGSGGNTTYRATAALGQALPADQLYGSYLFSTTTHTSNAKTLGSFAVGAANNNTDNTAAFVWAGNGYNSAASPALESPGIRAQQTNTWGTPTVSLTANETYLMLFTFNATMGTTSAWVLNQGQLTNYLDSDTLDATGLDGAALGTADTEVVWKGSATAAAAIAPMSYLHLFGLQSNGTGNNTFSFTWDELRISDTSLLQAATIPEPSAAVFGAIGMLGLLRRRR
ncbi:hypothetical protein JIN84_13110 [Luteolibacter yonseiensis]|uniref:PEP-CTERM protein-sorting domain-containing protein n=1 Tax=Luteolibacter yonseiensis TaxID=1144680 RepID=A0A934R1B1_9BACT|nr:hypothetical protein [Luteolibacter yonseiensis]MBK1816558.1 hypothetical protein [Luteolibacter yonseiensis]